MPILAVIKVFSCKMYLLSEFFFCFSDLVLSEAPMHQADPALLYPPALSPHPGSPLTHLGTLLAGHDAPVTGDGWDG